MSRSGVLAAAVGVGLVLIGVGLYLARDRVLSSFGLGRVAVLKEWSAPTPSTWRPAACRPFELPEEAPAASVGWKGLHADARSSDEVAVAIAPGFQLDWVTEPDSYHVTGPVFDSAGNVYLSPYFPHDDVALVSLDPKDGSRRFAVSATSAAPVGFSAPIVLGTGADEIVVQVLRDRAFAVAPSGDLVWDVVPGFPEGAMTGVIGLQHHAGRDAIVALSTDGVLVALDRATGRPVVPALRLPGAPSPRRERVDAPEVEACFRERFAKWVDLDARMVLGGNPGDLILGHGVVVADSFSLDPLSGRLWVVATAPDAADGQEDGSSEWGALYGFDLEAAGFVERCRATFPGTSVTTPAVRVDGKRIYVGDSNRALVAFDDQCEVAWKLDVGADIIGSIAVSSDQDGVYVPTSTEIFQVLDRGSSGERGWTSDLRVFDVEPPLVAANVNLATIGANGLVVQIALMVQTPFNAFPVSVAMALLDRATGAPRWATRGAEETLSVMSVAPDGSLVIGSSPLRRVITECIAERFPSIREVSLAGDAGIDEVFPPLAGGVARYAPTRLEWLATEAACAAAVRLQNLRSADSESCPGARAHDGRRAGQLAFQALRALEGLTGGKPLPAELAAVATELAQVAGGDTPATPTLDTFCAPAS